MRFFRYSNKKGVISLIGVVLFLSFFLNTSSVLAVVDITPPEILDVKIKNDPLQIGEEIYVEAKIEDDSGIAQVLIEVEGYNYTMIPKNTNKWIFESWAAKTAGSYQLTIYVLDNSKNWNQASVTIKVVPDETPPSVIIVEEPKEITEKEEILTVSLVAEDISGIKQALLEFEGMNYSMVNIPDTEVWKYQLKVPEEEGTYSYKIYIEDMNGNWNITFNSFEVIGETSTEIEEEDKEGVSELESPPFLPIIFLISILFLAGFILGGFFIKSKMEKSQVLDREEQSLIEKISDTYKISAQLEAKKNQPPMKSVEVECPVCHLKKEINIPENQISESSGIVTISIPKNVVCPHTFQIFLGRSFEIRGYQQVDYEVEN